MCLTFVRTLTIVLALLICPWKTLAAPQIWQPLVLEGRQLGPLVGRPDRQLEVLAQHQDKLEPIPFQLDQRSGDGRFLLSSGHQTESLSKVLSPSDQIVMMVSDLGHSCNVTCDLPPSTLQVSFFVPSDGTTRYAYIAAVDKPTLSSRSYVDYDATANRIETDGYRLTFVNEFPADFALQASAWAHHPNMIADFQILGETKLFGFAPIRLTNVDIQGQLVGFRAGQIRLIRQVVYWLRLPFGIRSPKVTFDELFYRNFGVMPVSMQLPWVPHFVFNKTSFRIAVQLDNANRYLLLSPATDKGQSRISQLNASRGDWIVLQGENGLLVQTFAPTPDLALIERQLYYQANHGPASSLDARQHAIVALQIDRLDRLSRGMHKFDPLFIALPSGYNLTTIVRQFCDKPVVTIRPAAMPTVKAVKVAGVIRENARTSIMARSSEELLQEAGYMNATGFLKSEQKPCGRAGSIHKPLKLDS